MASPHPIAVFLAEELVAIANMIQPYKPSIVGIKRHFANGYFTPRTTSFLIPLIQNPYRGGI